MFFVPETRSRVTPFGGMNDLAEELSQIISKILCIYDFQTSSRKSQTTRRAEGSSPELGSSRIRIWKQQIPTLFISGLIERVSRAFETINSSIRLASLRWPSSPSFNAPCSRRPLHSRGSVSSSYPQKGSQKARTVSRVNQLCSICA